MPLQPSESAVHTNRPLTNISVAFMQDQNEFIADKVIPNISVQKKSDTFFTYDQAYWTADNAKKRAPSTKAPHGGYEISTDSYNCEKYSIGKAIADEVVANADSPLNPESEAAMWVARQLLIRKEILFAETYMATSVWATDKEGQDSVATDAVVYWDDYTNSNPIVDVRLQSLRIQEATGYKPNTLVLTPDVKNKLLDHPDLLARINGGATNVAPAFVTDALLARAFDVPRVFTAGAIKNTAAEGQTKSNSFVMGAKALLLYVAPNPGLMTPSAAYNFSWTGFNSQVNNMGMYTKRYRDETIESIMVEGNMFFDMKVISTSLGCLFNNVIEE